MQRTLAAWVLGSEDATERLATIYHYDLAVADFIGDFWSYSALAAAANVAARGETVTLDAVRAWLQSEHDRKGPHRAGEERPDLAWLDLLVHHAPLHEPVPVAQLCAAVRRAASQRSTNAPFGRSFREFIGAEEPPDSQADIFDADGLIVRGEPSLFIGDPKVGKTLLLTDLVLHLAAGRPEWLGRRLYHRRRVLLFLREDSERTTQRRIWQIARGAGIEHRELEDHLIIDVTSPLYIDDPAIVKRLRAQLADVDICAIDSLSTIHNADENSVEGMAPVMNTWRDLALGTGTSLPIVHHFRKRGGDSAPAVRQPGSVLQRARGSSIIGATTCHAVGIERGPDDDQIVIAVESNHEVDVQPFVIRRRCGTDERGRKYIRHERVGSVVDARDAKVRELVDPVVLAIVRRAGLAGIGPRELRDLVRAKLKEERGKGLRNDKIDDSADRLETQGQIARVGEAWRAA